MAAIEKVDELTGEYPSYDMYRYKHNHIQVCPWNRKQFKNKQAILYIQKEKDPECRIYWDRTLSCYESCKISELKERVVFWDDKYYCERTFQPRWIKIETTYALYVPNLQGRVNGFYLNYTTKISTVKRKMKRLLGCRKLNVQYVEDIESVRPPYKENV
jgi:hypothetical protein